ncbi:ATP-binding SpoIIE family protein phosphatase [Microbacterium sp.]|uniref:ATP-binding SpoIIE family protein phosphatase n=1 Tax=Microbacterium sp. TaxID=51671 RepID=UPI003C72FA4B
MSRVTSTSSRADRRTARRTARAEHTPIAERIAIEIDAADTVLDYLVGAAGPVEVSALPTTPATERMRAQGVALVVPLIASGELVGILALGPRRSERGYARSDLRLLDALARYAAPALRLGQLMRTQEQQARDRERIEQELHVAQLIQQQFLPTELPDLGGWHLDAVYLPARTVGGDFYDVIDLGAGRVMIVTGDVTDKGVPAALVMASTHALLRAAAVQGVGPGEVLHRVNNLLVPQIPANMFVTCLALVLDLATGSMTFANAGHNLPYIRRRDGEVDQLSARGMPLGLLPGSRYDEVATTVAPGELLLLYSDGITEQHDAVGEMFDYPRTEAVVREATGSSDLVRRVTAALTAFQGEAEQEDDITLVALHRGDFGGDERSATATVRFAVPSELGNEREVMDRVAAAVGSALPDDRLDALKTAVSETAMNAIEHGNRANPRLDCEVAVRRTAEAVVVEIGDFGRGRQSPADIPDLDLKLAGLQSARGWGLFLTRSLVDDVDELADGDRHIVRLTMRTTLPEGDAQ